MKTTVSKGVHGWRVETEFPLAGDRYLQYTTMKRSSGVTLTTACVMKVEHGMSVFAPFSDFNDSVHSAKIERVTEKAICEHHRKALMKHEEVMAKVRAYYSNLGVTV